MAVPKTNEEGFCSTGDEISSQLFNRALFRDYG